MKLKIKKNNENPRTRLRQLGYAPYVNKLDKSSFVKRIQGTEFPRFHLYVNKESDTLLFCSIHLDQNAPLHKGAKHVHSADQDTDVVKNEAKRLSSN